MKHINIKYERPPKDLEEIIDKIHSLLDEAGEKDYPLSAMLQFGCLTVFLGEYPLMQLQGF